MVMTPEDFKRAMASLEAIEIAMGTRPKANPKVNPKATLEQRLAGHDCVVGYRDEIAADLYDRDYSVRLAAAGRNLTAEHVDIALADSEPIIKCMALRSSGVQVRHLDRAIVDSSESVQIAAVKHSLATSAHVDIALKSRSWTVRLAAMMSHAATRLHTAQGLKDEEPQVRIEALKKAPDFLARQLLGDVDRVVRHAAFKRLEELNRSTRHLDGVPT